MDHGGHLIGKQFGGSGNLDNLVAQSKTINQPGGDWYKLEQEWAEALKRGENVTVDIKPIYAGDSIRPTRFDVEYVIDGKTFSKKIPNV